jgi:hypothetical protein
MQSQHDPQKEWPGIINGGNNRNQWFEWQWATGVCLQAAVFQNWIENEFPELGNDQMAINRIGRIIGGQESVGYGGEVVAK